MGHQMCSLDLSLGARKAMIFCSSLDERRSAFCSCKPKSLLAREPVEVVIACNVAFVIQLDARPSL